MKKVKLILYILIFISFIYILFNLNSSINNLSLVLISFFKSLFPYLFVFMIINQILIKTNLITLIGYILQFILYPLFKINAKTIVLLILSLMNGFPSSTLYASILIKNNKIDTNSASKISTLFFLPSFTFIFYIIKNNLSNIYFNIFIISLYLPCFLLLYIKRKSSNDKYINFTNIKEELKKGVSNFDYFFDLKNIFFNTTMTIINILGMITVYSIISLIIPIDFIKGLLEFSMPSLSILNSNLSELMKTYLLLLILSFSSFSAISQASIYLPDIEINSLIFIKKRIEILFLSLLVFTILIYFCFL